MKKDRRLPTTDEIPSVEDVHSLRQMLRDASGCKALKIENDFVTFVFPREKDFVAKALGIEVEVRPEQLRLQLRRASDLTSHLAGDLHLAMTKICARWLAELDAHLNTDRAISRRTRVSVQSTSGNLTRH